MADKTQLPPMPGFWDSGLCEHWMDAAEARITELEAENAALKAQLIPTKVLNDVYDAMCRANAPDSQFTEALNELDLHLFKPTTPDAAKAVECEEQAHQWHDAQHERIQQCAACGVNRITHATQIEAAKAGELPSLCAGWIRNVGDKAILLEKPHDVAEMAFHAGYRAALARHTQGCTTGGEAWLSTRSRR